MYHISIERYISMERNNIKMGKRILLKIDKEIDKWFFFWNFLANDISLDNVY